MFKISQPIRGRPGRRVYPSNYIEGLQNQNLTNLLEIFNQAPDVIGEVEYEDPDQKQARNLIEKAAKSGAGWFLDQSGLGNIIPNLRGQAQALGARYQNRLEFQFRQAFLPMQGLGRDIAFAYESYTNQYRAGAEAGAYTGGLLGAGLGFYFLGPLGASILGPLGQFVGSLLGAFLQSIGIGFDGVMAESVRRINESVTGYSAGSILPVITGDTPLDLPTGGGSDPNATPRTVGRDPSFYANKPSYWKIVELERRMY